MQSNVHARYSIAAGFLVMCSIAGGNGCSRNKADVAGQHALHVRLQRMKASVWQKADVAIEAGDTKDATRYATQMLRENTDRTAWYYGNVVHEANQILGLAAMRESRIADAKRYLIAAGNTPGSPQLDSFGPNMVLAQALLAKGERQTVIRYLNLVAKFWAHTSKADLKRLERKKPGSAASFEKMDRENQRRIDTWKRQIRAGKQPKLNDSDSLF